jgi:heat-inducible transcriptional repressor
VLIGGVALMLTDREAKVLKIIVDEYINSSIPVGSRFISKNSDLNLSPASIRNIMSDLEEKGFLEQTHVSSGRIPTDKGFRYYVDQFVTFNKELINKIKDIEKVNPINMEFLFKEISRKLGEVSHSVGFVVSPKINSMYLKHIEFLRLNRESVLCIVVTKSGIVHNLIMNMGPEYTDQDLQRVSNYLNMSFHNKSLMDIKNSLYSDMASKKEEFDEVARKAKQITSDYLLNHDFGGELVIYGTKNILGLPEFKDSDSLKNLLDFFEEKTLIYEIIEKCIQEPTIKIFIGSEITDENLNLSLVTKPYKRDDKVIGTLGVIGPKRMRYPDIIPVVDYTAEIMSKLLNKIGGEDE